MKIIRRVCVAILLLLPRLISAAPLPAVAAEYQLPGAELQAIVDAPAAPTYLGGPLRRVVAQFGRAAMPDLKVVDEQTISLAGVTISTKFHAGARTQFSNSLSLLSIADGKSVAVRGLPPAPRIADARFSPDEQWLALSLWEDDGVKLWLVDVKAARARRLLSLPLNSVLSTGFAWLAGSDTLLVSLVPARPSRAEPTPRKNVPVMTEFLANAAPQPRTGADHLKSLQDADVLDWYLARQLARVDVGGRVTKLGAPDRFLAVAASPDGRYLLASRLLRPYSDAVAVDRFPRVTEVLDREGARVIGLHENGAWERGGTDRDVVEAGPRQFGWRADAPATLYWASALDDGDPARAADYRDAVYMRAAPFRQPPVLLVRLKGRLARIMWGSDDLAVAAERWGRQRLTRTWRLRPGQADAAPTPMFEVADGDRYGDPGKPLQRTLANGEQVLATTGDDQALIFSADGAGPEGDQPLISRYNLADGRFTTLWRSRAPYYEKVLALLDRDGRRFVTQRESSNEPPNLYVREGDGAARQLTHHASPAPWMSAVESRQLAYVRADGVPLSAKLYLPPGYRAEADGRLPVLVWVYPQEFRSKSAAAQVQGSPYRYAAVDPRGPLPMLRLGYAVLDGPAMPIIGDAGAAPNDSYVGQLAASAEAAVAEIVRIGVADPRRIAVGGHSYGAFTVANLLAHTKLFAAGVGLSGAYNRTLTPFGFQLEARALWQAPQVYQAMSPFNYADQINAPLLLVHGLDDSNPGTPYLQSERMFSALKGLGRTTRLVGLPREDHLYRARESILHVLWEEQRWLDRFVKHGGEEK